MGAVGNSGSSSSRVGTAGVLPGKGGTPAENTSGKAEKRKVGGHSAQPAQSGTGSQVNGFSLRDLALGVAGLTAAALGGPMAVVVLAGAMGFSAASSSGSDECSGMNEGDNKPVSPSGGKSRPRDSTPSNAKESYRKLGGGKDLGPKTSKGPSSGASAPAQ